MVAADYFLAAAALAAGVAGVCAVEAPAAVEEEEVDGAAAAAEAGAPLTVPGSDFLVSDEAEGGF